MIIDGHAHAARDYSTASSILRLANRQRIEKIVLCTSPKNILDLRDPPNVPLLSGPNSIFLLNRTLRLAYRSMKDNGDGNRFVFELGRQLPDMVVPFLYVNPLDPLQMSSVEQRIREYRPRGIKLHQAWDPFSVGSEEFGRLLEVARAHALPAFIHVYSKGEMRKLLRFIEQNRDVVFVIAHLLGLDILGERRECLGNVYYDTSGSHRVRGRDIVQAISLVGADHVVFGSDMPYARIGDQIDKLQRLNLSDAVLEQIFSENMRRLLSLPSRPRPESITL
jgi:predicted TIM-barrel fold metal-dependent hydrolase